MSDALTMLILDRDVLVPRVRAGDVLSFHHAGASTLLLAIGDATRPGDWSIREDHFAQWGRKAT